MHDFYNSGHYYYYRYTAFIKCVCLYGKRVQNLYKFPKHEIANGSGDKLDTSEARKLETTPTRPHPAK